MKINKLMKERALYIFELVLLTIMGFLLEDLYKVQKERLEE